MYLGWFVRCIIHGNAHIHVCVCAHARLSFPLFHICCAPCMVAACLIPIVPGDPLICVVSTISLYVWWRSTFHEIPLPEREKRNVSSSPSAGSPYSMASHQQAPLIAWPPKLHFWQPHLLHSFELAAEWVHCALEFYLLEFQTLCLLHFLCPAKWSRNALSHLALVGFSFSCLASFWCEPVPVFAFCCHVQTIISLWLKPE